MGIRRVAVGALPVMILAAILSVGAFSASAAQDWVGDITRDLNSDVNSDPNGERAPARALSAPGAAGPIAVVGHARIGADEAFELWTPLWRETQTRVRNGKLAPAEGDRRLQAEWQRVVLALIKDELFFQEAEREHTSLINSIVERMMRGGADRSRGQMQAHIRKLMEQDMQRFFRELNSSVVKDSGGIVKLHKVLEGRGLSFSEWQSRLQKKAFTQSYLHQVLKPRAPDPGPRRIQMYYAEHPDEFAKPGVVRFRHIFFSNAERGPEQARDDAVAVWEQLVDGEIGFEDAAREYSDDAESAARGGLETEEEARDPGREAWLADIRAALREEEPGGAGPILESPFGCHVAELISVGPRQKIPFSEVRREIEQKLMAKLWEEETDKYFAAIRQKTDIRVMRPMFPSALSCAAVAGAHAAGGGPRVYSTAFPGVHSPRGAEQ